LDALVHYAPRYAIVASRAGASFSATAGLQPVVQERLPGTATTDFGVPGVEASSDREPMTREQARLLTSIVRAAWSVFEETVATAPEVLSKGPRGGGRDRDAIAEHVLAAEVAYGRKLGLQGLRQPAPGDARAVTAMRDSLVETLLSRSESPEPRHTGWPARYAARRIAWHVLDHAWEIEDRSR